MRNGALAVWSATLSAAAAGTWFSAVHASPASAPCRTVALAPAPSHPVRSTNHR
jgi:hypothetical protein